MSEPLTHVIDEALRKMLGRYGFEHADVQFREDHDGEPALFNTADLAPGAPFIEANVSDEAHRLVSEALLERGEKRFPYLYIRHPDQERPDPAESLAQ
jgi:hypothetical protein